MANQGIVRMVVLQFSCSNPEVIPPLVKRLNRETPAERVERKSCSSGVMIIEPTENCSLVGFLGELEAAGYELVDAFYKQRIHVKDPSGKRSYHMVRFLFAHCNFVEQSDEFKQVRDNIRAELWSMCEDALWRIRLFSNPFYKNGREIPGQSAISINLEVRQPLFCPDGQPVTVWRKDQNGQRMGAAPLPLKADYYLRIVGHTVRLMRA